jgi:hypothetical protein
MYNVYCRSCKKEIASDIAVCPHCKHDQSQVVPPPASMAPSTTYTSSGYSDTASAYAALEQGKAKQSAIYHDGGGFDWRVLRWALIFLLIPLKMCARSGNYNNQRNNPSYNNTPTGQYTGLGSDSR